MKLRECDPTYPRSSKGISGLLAPDFKFVGIDFRVQDGKLYGVGNGGGIYVIDTNTAVAIKSATTDGCAAGRCLRRGL